ncbi:MAG: efflux RND transporter periplasmic adaptor subunit [Blastocatellia bacterium]
MATKKSRRLTIAGIILVAVIGAGAWSFTALSRGKNGIDASRLATVERGDIARSVVATGRIEPVSKVEIKSKANGIIKELKVNVNDFVMPGQVLAELDKDNLAARVREAKAALQAAEANLTAARAQYEKNKVEAEGPDVPFLNRNKSRVEQLVEDGLLPKSNLDDASSQLALGLNRRNIAKSQLSVTEAKVKQADAEVAQARASVERAEEELNYATIRSPIRGVVLSRDVEIGSPVSSILNMGSMATLVMTLGDISEVYVKGKVDEADIGVVKLSQPARIKVETFKDKQFEGRVTQISPLGNEKENVITFEVRVSINNPAGLLRANMTANAEIVQEEHKGALLIPESAIIYDDKRNASVEVPAPGTPKGKEKKPIKTGVSNGSKTEVLNGLKEGDKIVLQ